MPGATGAQVLGPTGADGGSQRGREPAAQRITAPGGRVMACLRGRLGMRSDDMPGPPAARRLKPTSGHRV
eukprot:352953-Chlamydomonas_euryale.AAC.4